MAERIQLRRTRGWRLPEGAVSVARPGRWGNPYTVAGAIENEYAATTDEARKVAVEFFRGWLLGLEQGDQDRYTVGSHAYDRLWMREHLPELSGKTLACWCPPGVPCHADVLAAVVSGEDEHGRVLMGVLHPHVPLRGWW
jgi:Domain of unknown function (DUF4326)